MLNFYKPYAIDCAIKNSTLSYETQCYKNNISPEAILNEYAPAGFHMFKLEGRSLSTMEVLLNYARYFIRPEHQMYFIHYMTQDLFNIEDYFI